MRQVGIRNWGSDLQPWQHIIVATCALYEGDQALAALEMGCSSVADSGSELWECDWRNSCGCGRC